MTSSIQKTSAGSRTYKSPALYAKFYGPTSGPLFKRQMEAVRDRVFWLTQGEIRFQQGCYLVTERLRYYTAKEEGAGELCGPYVSTKVAKSCRTDALDEEPLNRMADDHNGREQPDTEPTNSEPHMEPMRGKSLTNRW